MTFCESSQPFSRLSDVFLSWLSSDNPGFVGADQLQLLYFAASHGSAFLTRRHLARWFGENVDSSSTIFAVHDCFSWAIPATSANSARTADHRRMAFLRNVRRCSSYTFVPIMLRNVALFPYKISFINVSSLDKSNSKTTLDWLLVLWSSFAEGSLFLSSFFFSIEQLYRSLLYTYPICRHGSQQF